MPSLASSLLFSSSPATLIPIAIVLLPSPFDSFVFTFNHVSWAVSQQVSQHAMI
jgi:hypothetical protein